MLHLIFLSLKDASGGLCLPVLCGRQCNAVLPEETVRYLKRLNISESLLLWREDVDLMTLHHTGKLSLTLLRDGLLDSSEYHALESSILRVVHHDGQQDTGDDAALSAVTTVAREIRQEAAEHIRATLGKSLGEALRLQNEAFWIKHGRQSTQLEDLRRSLEQLSDATADAELQDMEQLLTAELKEFSDGEMTIALSSVTTVKEHWIVNVDGLNAFSQHHGLDGLVVLLSISDTVHHPGQQVAVYSNNTDILNQICCELEESSSWSLFGQLEARENLQVYHIPINTPSSIGTLLVEEIQGLLKDFVDRRSSVLACHPSSRSSSTEGVAGSVEFSQGSSGINDMDGSDIERVEGGSADVAARARGMADGEEDTRGVEVSAGGELVSPDSGMTTLRSSRSSKESSVFLSDDSPVGEVTAGGGPAAGPGGIFLRNPPPLGLSSLSPPVPPERKKNRSCRNKSDNFDLFSFDPLHSSDPSLPAGGELTNSEVRGDGTETRSGSSNLSELEELSFMDFSAGSRNSSVDHHGQIHGNEMTDTVVPPTPVNSLVGSRPPSRCGIRFFPEDVVERINCLQHKDSVSSSLSETWDELCFDTQGALSSSDNNASNRTKDYESPQNIIEDIRGKESLSDVTEIESREEILKPENSHQRPKSLQPQLSVVTGQTESYENWNPDSVLKDEWNPVTLADLQLTPPEEEGTGKCKAGDIGSKGKTTSLSKKKAILNTLTPDTSKEEDKGVQGKKEDQKMELLDFWTYSAQKGFLKSDSGTTESYPESLDMWNMTIRDDSLSPLTTPDNLSENSGSFCGMNRNLLGGTSVESPPGFCDGGMEMWNTTIQEDSSSTITSPEGPDNGKDLSHMGSPDAHSPETHASIDMHDLSVPGMVTSTSEYDNVGAGVWSLSSSPETFASPVVDVIQPQGQSSPFFVVTNPIHIDEKHDQSQRTNPLGKTECRSAISDTEQSVTQMFLFEGTCEVGHITSSIESEYDNKNKEGSAEADWIEQSSDYSPFVMVDSSMTHSESASLSHALPITVAQNEDGTAAESQRWANIANNGNVEGKITETMGLGSSSGVKRDTLKFSPDSLQPGSGDELRSNSDGDSSSGLEMEYIVVSGTVKEAEREWDDRPKQGDKQTKRTRKPMETFSTLYYAATVLGAHREHQENTEQSRQNQNQAVLSTHYLVNLDNSTEHDMVPEKVSPSQSKNTLEATGCNQPQVFEGNYDDKSSIVARSVSPSLRFPSDIFLKTREEVYVHSQISMEDSDEGGQSPSAPPLCPTSLGDFQDWGGQLVRHDTPRDTSETQSPVLTNSSVSHPSSLTGTPLSELGISTDRGLGLPFSGDLMEEENDEEEQEEETDMENTTLSKWTSGDESYYEAGVNAEYSLDDPDSKIQNMMASVSMRQTILLTSLTDSHSTNRMFSLRGKIMHSMCPRDLFPFSCQAMIIYVVAHYCLSVPLSRHSQQRDGAVGMMTTMPSSEETAEELEDREDPPSSADLSGSSNQRRKLAAPPLSVSLDRSEGSLLSEDALDTGDEALDTGDDLDINIDELDTPDEADSLELHRHGDSEESKMAVGAASCDVVVGHGSAEESRESKPWRSVLIGEQEHRIDMKSIAPYKRVISHGGYYAEQNAIIVFAACFLPDSNCDNYNYVMENLFLYVISTLELMVAEDYMIVYLNGATPRRRMPGFSWMKKCYQMIDRRLKKNLKMFIIVHPSWFIRTLLGITRPFISSKFSNKIKYVNSLRELGKIIPMEYVHIPTSIVKLDTDLQDTAAKADQKRGNSTV
ncbi:putative protein prune -like 2 isoform 4 [Scophthalmus maximus]|uniref:CRAL-TRIO domain-containing protein n=1 Tax=Scophthalmus maximus TaxID=52904 RepID=A0A2U9BUM3_SCOMX|nr:putative protein prune -like 2 isoform 4 [Scophthalmus maximus]